MKDMEGYTIGATDGIIGEVRDFYFDDHAWAIRYLVVDTGESPALRKVLISPIAIVHPNWSEKIFRVALTRHQVRGSPDKLDPSGRQRLAAVRRLDLVHFGIRSRGPCALWSRGLSEFRRQTNRTGLGGIITPIESCSDGVRAIAISRRLVLPLPSEHRHVLGSGDGRGNVAM
jgi:hypothetical protein